MNANRISLAAINGSPFDPLVMGNKPQLTYSSVIQSLVEHLTQRSPFLQRDTTKDSLQSEIAHLYRDELLTGRLLGQGNFSNVYELSQLCLCRSIHSVGQGTEGGVDLGEGQSTASYPKRLTRPRPGAAEKRRWQLRSDLKRSDGSCSFAVKCLKPELLEHPSPKVFLEAATDLVIEAKYLARFNHANILKLRGISCEWEKSFANGEYDSFFFIVDRLEETLNKRIKRWRSGEHPEENTLEKKLPLARQLASALEYLADRQLLFRDCKPQNIGLARNADNSLSIKLFDFGFCRQLPEIDQERRDEAENAGIPAEFSTLPSGETVYAMSGKGTRRYMAPEVILLNRYNLKADVYSWSMVVWELLLLQKPYYKYSKDQHRLLVCEGGDRPPLEPTSQRIWPTSSLQSLSASFSSIPSSPSDDEDSLDFDSFMTDPIRDLLARAWDQDVEQRFTIKQVSQALDDIILASKKKIKLDYSNPRMSLKDILHISQSSQGYSCLSSAMAEYRGVRDIVAELSNDMPDLPFLGCFNRHSGATNPVHSESLEKKATELSAQFDLDRENEKPQDNIMPETKSSLMPVPQLGTLLVQ